MIFNYFKILFRQLIKNRSYSIINIGGLAIGIGAVMLIAIYVQFEHSYDREFRHSEQLYRVNLTSHSEGVLVEKSARTSPAMGSAFLDEIPSVEDFSRVVILGEVIAGFEEDYIREENIFLTDPRYFDFFDLEVQGHTELMQQPLKATVSEKVAQKIFGDEDPIGKMLDINSTNFNGSVEFEIVGVFETPEANRHLRPEILISYATLHHFIGKEIDQSYDWLNLYTFVKLTGKQDLPAINEQINEVLDKHHGHNLLASNTDWQLHLQPVNEIHTTLEYAGEYEQGVDGKKIKYFLWVAGFILLMVYLNSINIANSKALTRYKEIGVRKASGGSKTQIFSQLMLESFIINLIAVILAGIGLHLVGGHLILLLDLSLPQTAFSFDRYAPSLFGLWIIGSLAAGLYPALWLTSFSPSSALKGSLKFKFKTAFARPLLVSQLVFCLIILSGILTIYYQLEHMRGQELGVSLEDKLVVRSPMLFVEGSGNYQEVIHNHFTQLDGVKNVGVANEIPGNEIYWRSDQFFKEGAEKSGAMFAMLHAGEQYLEVFGIEIKAGRTFNTALEEGSEAIINEKAREALGFKDSEEALGQKLMYSGWGEPRGVEIVGVVADYRQRGVNVQVDPLVLNFSPGDLNYYIVEVEKGQMAKVLPQIESTFTELFPTSPFEFYFLDEHFDKQYKSESQFVRLFGLAAFVAIIIAVMGIIGVTTQLIIQRNKEMSIRKILGASYENVFLLISKEYMTWLLSCFLLGIPASYLLFSRWLDNFLLRIELGWWFFVLPAFMVTIIFVSSTIFLTVKTALVNPAETLKSE